MHAHEPSALVIGACGGIAKAVVAELRRQNCFIIAADIETPINGDINFVVDLRSLQSVNKFVAELGDVSLRSIIYVAGLYPIVTFEQYTPELWSDVLMVNVTSAFRIIQQLAARISDGGRIVLVSSVAADRGSSDVGYSTSKAAVSGLTRSLARALASRSILVNAICPGLIRTAMSSRMNVQHYEKWRTRALLGRAGEGEEVAVGVMFLLDPRNTFMTGSILTIDGGLSIG